MSRDTILTERQIEVLKLKAMGLSTSEIARRLGTTDANVSATEKKARENIKRAQKTLQLVKILEAPIRIVIPPKSDLNDVVREIYRQADETGIWISHNFPSLAALIQEKAGEKIKGRMVREEIEVAITRKGEVVVL